MKKLQDKHVLKNENIELENIKKMKYSASKVTLVATLVVRGTCCL